MIPLSHYNWFGEPPLKEKIKDILMITWIVFLCPVAIITALTIVFWFSAKHYQINKTTEQYQVEKMYNNERVKE